MSETHPEAMPTDLDRPDDGLDLEPPSLRPWYRRTPFLVFTGGVLVVVGNYFLGLIAVVLLAGDRTRDPDSRIGGAVLIFAWMFTWTLPGASPYVAFALLGIAAAFLGRSALARRAGRIDREWRGVAALAAVAALLAVLSLVPYGVRSSRFDADEAAAKVLAARVDGTSRDVGPGDFPVFGALAFQDDFRPITPSRQLVAPARLRFTNTPIYYVVLFEQNPNTALTGDGEPCFSASETHSVHGLSGEVVHLGRQDARKKDGGCLPLPRGTRTDIEDLSTS